MGVSNDYIHNLLTKGKDVPVDTKIEADKVTLPPWYDEKLFTCGQKFYTRNILGMFMAMGFGLIGVLSIPTILKILIGTKKSSTSKTAYQRYMRTIYHVFYWHWYTFGIGYNGNGENIKIRNKKIFKSLMVVRKTHFTSSEYSLSIGNGFISQKDMAITQFGFMGFLTLKAKYLGLRYNDETLAGTLHFWRVIGYLLGIKDEYNLCTNDWNTTKDRLEVMLEEVYKPSLTNAGEDFLSLATPMVRGIWSLNPFFYVDAFIYMTKRLANCDGYEYFNSEYNSNKRIKSNKTKKLYKELSMWNRFIVAFHIFILQFLYPYKIFKWIFDFQSYISLFLITYLPILAIPRFGIRDSYIRIKM